MTTPMHVYRELAVKHGKIDPAEPGAVNRFFEKDVYSLSKITQLRIISTLFRHIGDKPEEYPYEEIQEEIPFPNPANYKRADARKS